MGEIKTNKYKANPIIKELYYHNDDTINGSEDSNAAVEQYILNEKSQGVGMEMPDMLSNVNGNHLYKLISAKDIDFNNVFLPHSNIDESMWADFDKNRRWPSNASIHINDAYELLNVIDYLLCTTKDLWSEINKMKYNTTLDNTIWFLNDLDKEMNSMYALDPAQFVRNSDYSVYLDPTKYYVTLPNPIMGRFGIGTFFVSNNETDRISRSITKKNENRNGINAYISNYGNSNTYYKMQVQNINGVNTNIYGYIIDGLQFYPMFDVENFLFVSRDENSFDKLLNKETKKFNYDVYFRTVKEVNGVNISKFHKVYADFLYNNYDNSGYPYILYFIDEDASSDEGKKKRNIIYIHTGDRNGDKTITDISNDLKPFSRYINYFNSTSDEMSLKAFGNENYVYNTQLINNVSYKIPILYHIKDIGTISLYIMTPNTEDYNETNATLDINYYKRQNNIGYKVNIDSLNGEEIMLMKDIEQSTESAILNIPKRYYLPDRTDIYIPITAIYTESNNNIKTDDEYIDVLLPYISKNEDVYQFVEETAEGDIQAKQYYYYSNLDENGKRIFINFNNAIELNKFSRESDSKAFIVNIDDKKCLHLYKKIEEPYKLKYSFSTNQLLKQEITDINIVENIVEEFKTQSELHVPTEEDPNKSTYLYLNKLDLNRYDDYEQIKFDINLDILETSKVAHAHANIPISLNKIHNPYIQFCSYDVMRSEISQDNFQKLAYTFGDISRELSSSSTSVFMFVNNTTPLEIPTTNAGNPKLDNPFLAVEENNDSGHFYQFSNIYNYLINKKYNNFQLDDYNINGTKTQKRSDLAYYVNSRQYNNYDHDNLKYSSFISSTEDPTTYDNTIDGSNIMSLDYHSTISYLGIFGDPELLRKKINKSAPNGVDYVTGVFFESLDLVTDSHFAQYKPKQSDPYTYIKFDTLFNINGLGINYRRHGGDSYIYINRDRGPVAANHQNVTNLNFENQYDLLSNVCLNDLNNICHFMEFTIDDNNNQFNTITRQGNILENSNSLKLIQNDILDINIYNEQIEVQQDGNKLIYGANNVSKITYFVPMSYMTINSTTFYPSKDILPSTDTVNKQYDLNNSDDIEKYQQYIKFWDSDDTNENSKHRPITLSLHLKENLTNNTPFFYESNTAKAKFKINRITIDTSSMSFNGESNFYVVYGQRYYIGDMVNVRYTSEYNKFCIGSYPLYNTATGHFKIKELFDKKEEYLNDNIGLPIKKVNGVYQYDIAHCSQLNKIFFTSLGFTRDTEDIWLSRDSNVLYDINTLFYIEINDDLIQLLKDSFPGFEITETINMRLNVSKIYGTKLYKNSSSINAIPGLPFKIVTRTNPLANEVQEIQLSLGTSNNHVIITGSTNIGSDYSFNYGGTRYKHYTTKVENDIDIFELPSKSYINKLWYYYNGSILPLTNIENILTNDKIFYDSVISHFLNYHLFEKVTQ